MARAAGERAHRKGRAWRGLRIHAVCCLLCVYEAMFGGGWFWLELERVATARRVGGLGKQACNCEEQDNAKMPNGGVAAAKKKEEDEKGRK